MNEKTGRNDPCPCGSGKKFKNCCLNKSATPKKIKAKWLNSSQKEAEGVNLMERTFGQAIQQAAQQEKPPQPPQSFSVSPE